jgi:hypothetical protein
VPVNGHAELDLLDPFRDGVSNGGIQYSVVQAPT